MGVAASASWGWAVWAAGSNPPPGPDQAHHLVQAILAARSLSAGDLAGFWQVAGAVDPNPGLWLGWFGAWGAALGVGERLAVACLFPAHLLLVVGLWRGGRALGGTVGAAFATAAGLSAAGPMALAHQVMLDFPLCAATAFAAGSALEGRWGSTGAGLGLALLSKLSAVPTLAGLAIDSLWRGRLRLWPGALALVLLVPGALTIASYAGNNPGVPLELTAEDTLASRLRFHLASLYALAQPAIVASVVLALLVRRDTAILRVLGWVAAMVAGLCAIALNWHPRYALPGVPLLAIAGAGASTDRWGRRGLGACVAMMGVQLAGWPAAPARLETPPADVRFDVDGVLDWLVTHRPNEGRARVAAMVDGSDHLHFPGLALAVLQRELPLDLVVVDHRSPLVGEVDLGLVIIRAGAEHHRQGWLDLLPPPSASWDWAAGYTVRVWDRPLPLEAEKSRPTSTEAQYLPDRQALYVRLDSGDEAGPLLTPASSADVIRAGDAWHAFYVRKQAVWHAVSVDGLAWSEGAPTGVTGVDPHVVPLDGGWRLYVAEIAGGNADADPAYARTAIVSYRGDLETWAREPGARVEGDGLVDPAVARTEAGWEMYWTDAASRVLRGVSPDGLAFSTDTAFRLDRTMVPAVLPDGRWMVAQRHVGGESVLFALPRAGEGFGAPVSLEVCGTSPSIVGGRVYYTRDPSRTCGAPAVDPSRRGVAPWAG
jgi:hypothetical protein